MQSLFRYSRYSRSWFTSLSSRNTDSFFSTLTDGLTSQIPSPVPPGPPPIRVAITESAGRGVFATRRIGTGETLHSAKPVISHPSPSAIDSVCYFCLRKITNLSFDQLQRVSFCSEDCKEHAKAFHCVERKSDWTVYDEYWRSRALKYPLLVKRFACMVISGAVSFDHLDILQPSILSSQIVSEMEEGFDLLKRAFLESNVSEEKMAFMTKKWYMGLLARIRINAFRIELVGGLYEDLLSAAMASVEAEASVGTAVYMLPSFYNHDCDPNAHIIWIDNVDAKLKALRDINEGEELRICYIDVSMSRGSRQTLLSEGFGFKCSCQRCLSGD